MPLVFGSLRHDLAEFYAPGHRRPSPSVPGRRFALGLLVPVAALPAVARYLPGDRPGVPFELTGYLALRQIPIQQDINLASFVIARILQETGQFYLLLTGEP